MSEFLQKCYNGILKQEAGIPDTLKTISEKDVEPLEGKRAVILTGAGDSYAVAQYGQWVLSKSDIIANAISPREIQMYGLGSESLVIGVTASGRSLSTMNALQYAKKQGAETLILTDNPQSKSLKEADHQWITKSGVETFDIAPAAPTTAAMAFMMKVASFMPEIGQDIVKEDWKQLQSGTTNILEWAKTWGKELANFIDVNNALYLISEGANYVAAHIGMMKFNEFSLQRTIISLREEFQHHFNLSLREGDRVVLLADSPTTEDDERYLEVLQDTLGVPSKLLHTPQKIGLQSSLAQAIANTITLQLTAFHVVSEIKPEMEWFKMPNAKAFKIY